VVPSAVFKARWLDKQDNKQDDVETVQLISVQFKMKYKGSYGEVSPPAAFGRVSAERRGEQPQCSQHSQADVCCLPLRSGGGGGPSHEVANATSHLGVGGKLAPG
jgi:hypothetical protein